MHRFCASDLSAFYLNIRKDCLYCDGENSSKRRASLAVLAVVFDYLCRWLAPVLVFTTDEAWKLRHGQDQDIHCHDFATHPMSSLGKYGYYFSKEAWWRWMQISTIVGNITPNLEQRRKHITTNAQAEILCYADDYTADLMRGIDMKELTMTASFEVKVDPDIREDFLEHKNIKGFEWLVKTGAGEKGINMEIHYRLTSHPKCSRCWRYEPQDEPHLKDLGICSRCYEVCYG